MPSRKDPPAEPSVDHLRQYRDLVETSQDLIWRTNAQGRWTYLNPAWEVTFGYKTEEMLGRIFSDFQSPDTAQRATREFARLIQAGSVKGYETVCIGKSGNRIHLLVNAKHVYDDRGQVIGACGTAHDITKRKQAEAGLRESEERFRKIVEQAPIAMAVVSMDGVIEFINQKAIQVFGYLPADIPNMERWWVQAYPEENYRKHVVTAWTALVQRAVTEGQEIPGNEYRVTCKDGAVKTMVISGAIIADRVFVLFDDHTERKRAEEALRKREERYRRLVETTDTGYVIVDSKGRVLDANQAYVRLAGHDRLDEILGRSVLEWTAAEERENNATAVVACLKDGSVRNLEITYVDRTGKRTPVEVNATVVETEGRETILSLCRDISQRKRAEEALRESEARYRALIDSSPDAITQTDLSGTILMCNRQTAHLHGYESPEDMIGRSAFELFAPDELEHAKLDMQRTLRDGVVRDSEYRFLKKDGSQFEAELSATVVRDAGGNPFSFVALTRDIGERKGMERALRESEERFSRLAQASFEGVAIHEKGRILDANPAMARLFGYEPSELIGMDVLSLATPESRELVRSKMLAGYEKPYEATGLKKDGTTFVGELNSRPMPYRGRVVRVTAIRDITERKRAEAAIAGEKERLAVTLRSIGDGVITTDIRGTVVIMNRVAEELTGWTQSEAEGKPLEAVFTIVDEMTRESCENPVARVLSTGGIIELANHALLTARNGTQRVIADSGAPITDRDGKTIGVVLVFRDMTEKQKTMDAIQRAARLDSLGVLAGGIAHDFNNLLTGLFGYVELARSVSKDARVIEYLEATLATMNRARALTLQLLTFAKGGAPAQKVTPLDPFIQEAVQFALSGANVSCQFSLPKDVWPCNIDKNQISQVIDNIVINAQQAMPNGGFLEIGASNVLAEDGQYPALVKGRYVKVSIKDQGIGIPKDVMPRIFDPFYTTKTKGHGLGLATCYSIVSRHGGCIDVESEPGKGSTFHVYLPASTEAAVVNAATIVRQTGSGTVIVVDDEEVVRNTVRRMVEALGFTVVCKRDGKEAIGFYTQESKAGQRFVAMILDLTIRGGMGGKETVAEIRKLDKKLPVFVASGYADDPVMRNPVEYGFTGSLGKPFTMAELSEMLRGSSKD